MASETSDLTFVRCPSCRSLVPASATRCRICNNPLDALHSDEGEEAKQGSSRVRQKTITASPQEVEAAIQAAQAARPAPPPPPPPQRPAAAAAAPQDTVDDLDPLGAYLQEIESGAVTAAPVSDAPQAASPMPAADDDDDLFDLDIFDDPADEPPAPKPQAAREAEPFRVELPLDEPPLAPEAAPEPPPRRPVEASARPAERQRPAAPPQQARPAAPEPRRNEGGRPQHDQQRGQQRSERMQEQRQAKPAPAPQQRAPEQNKPRRDDRDNRDNRRQDRPQRQEPPRRDHERREEMSDRAPVTGPKTGKMRPGRLFGWLVSYESPDGRAIELREGKFFVTASSIKGSDLVLEDPSISTPHALMSISESGLLVQDLMSDNGVFVRAEGDGDYRREDGIIRVAHGDWIRFGDVEFLVIVVPSSAK